jgi:WD40 repeat protein
VVGVDTVEAVRNNQKVAELRSGGANRASSGASATAIAAAGSLIAIGFGVGWQWQQSSPRMPGRLLTPRAFFLSSLIHPSINDMNSYCILFYFLPLFTQDQKVRLYDWDGKSFQEDGILEANRGLVSALAFSPDGLKLAAGDVSAFLHVYSYLSTAQLLPPRLSIFFNSMRICGAAAVAADSGTHHWHVSFSFLIKQKKSSGKVILYDVAKREVITSRWAFHSARVNSLSWTADSLHCASGALDTHIYVWSVQKPVKNIAIKNAVAGGVNAVLWLSAGDEGSGSGRLAGAGADAGIKVWQVKFHA